MNFYKLNENLEINNHWLDAEILKNNNNEQCCSWIFDSKKDNLPKIYSKIKDFSFIINVFDESQFYYIFIDKLYNRIRVYDSATEENFKPQINLAIKNTINIFTNINYLHNEINEPFPTQHPGILADWLEEKGISSEYLVYLRNDYVNPLSSISAKWKYASSKKIETIGEFVLENLTLRTSF